MRSCDTAFRRLCRHHRARFAPHRRLNGNGSPMHVFDSRGNLLQLVQEKGQKVVCWIHTEANCGRRRRRRRSSSSNSNNNNNNNNNPHQRQEVGGHDGRLGEPPSPAPLLPARGELHGLLVGHHHRGVAHHATIQGRQYLHLEAGLEAPLCSSSMQKRNGLFMYVGGGGVTGERSREKAWNK